MTSQAIAILEHEHRVIERVLASLETYAEASAAGDSVPREALRQYAEFFASFADRCHHAKEEDLLFVQLTRHGFSRDQGPVAVMLAEHTEGRAHVRALGEIGKGEGELSDSEREAVYDHAFSYIAMLRSHIQKEDHVLYAMAERVLPSIELADLVRSFEELERNGAGEVEHRRLRELADLLVMSYPPRALASPECAVCAGCGAF